jgi:pimeloyl-ACP methyl ester carboxylesterase
VPVVTTSDGVRLYAEATGSGLPVLFIHEFASDHRTWSRQADDAIDVLDAFGIVRAHVVGLSMGGFCALQLGIRYPDRVSSLLVASAGSGASPGGRAAFIAETEQTAWLCLERHGAEAGRQVQDLPGEAAYLCQEPGH